MRARLAIAAAIIAAIASAFAACDSAPDPCTVLFGTPNASTGLGPDQCRPMCACGADVFAPPAYDASFIESLASDWTLTTPYASIDVNPYASPAPSPDGPDVVCGVLPQAPQGTAPRPYTLVTYASTDAARAAGASPTHYGHCGVCSTLANLAVYMREPDLGAPARACGVVGIADGGDANVACLEAIGFDHPCAQAWYWDTLNTRNQCIGVCITTPATPYQAPDGALNPCIQCDEDQSGPIFKSVAGRTRRNSGLPNALCRPCSEVQPLVHAY
jgi:hypothetical protein